MTRTASEIVDHITSGENFINAAKESMPTLATLIAANPKHRTEWLKRNTTLADDVISGTSVDDHAIVLAELTRICRTWNKLSNVNGGKVSWAYSLPKHVSALKFLRLELDLINQAEVREGYSHRWGIRVNKSETWQ